MFPAPIYTIPCRMMRILFFLVFLATPTHIYSWDLAVASDVGLNFLHLEQGQLEGPISQVNNESLAEMYALAYDPSNGRFFFSINDATSGVNFYDQASETVTNIIPGDGQFVVQGIAYDSLSHVLYWTDGNGHTIHKLEIVPPIKAAETLIFLPTQVPTGIAVTYCHRAIFWVNTNHTSASLDRVEVDGTNHLQIVTKDISQPLGVTVDEAYGKVYWTDDRVGIYYRIERCSLDGTNRELLIQRTNQQPFGIALVSSTLLWSDLMGKVWSLSIDMTFPNHTSARLVPDLVYQDNQRKPAGIAANRNVTVSCEPVKVLRPVVEPVEPTEETLADSVPVFCLNGGVGSLWENGQEKMCQCKRGFSGRRCEIDLCYQRCLHGGSCYLDQQGWPDCRCVAGYEGRRCEYDVCHEYCLAGGRCSVESGQPTCQCPASTSGQRCEVSAVAATLPNTNDVPVIAGLAAVGSVLVVIVLILTWRVIVLRRRPRVKKRYIVNKGFRSQSGQTPMTSRPPVSPAIEQCEITIENCCNMNICETPCFEPNLRTTKSSNRKSEDRRNLLKNMEGPAGSD